MKEYLKGYWDSSRGFLVVPAPLDQNVETQRKELLETNNKKLNSNLPGTEFDLFVSQTNDPDYYGFFTFRI